MKPNIWRQYMEASPEFSYWVIDQPVRPPTRNFNWDLFFFWFFVYCRPSDWNCWVNNMKDMIWTSYSHVDTQEYMLWWTCHTLKSSSWSVSIVWMTAFSADSSPVSPQAAAWTLLERDMMRKCLSFVWCFVFHQGLSCRQVWGAGSKI